MQVSNPNEIKIYNLSQGPTLPEWIANRKSKKDDVSFQRRIELIQDFEMPHITDGVICSPDGHYILTHGVYKPRIRCYDVRNLSMKFERCTDSEIVKMCMLSEDYSKPVLLQADRYVEFHAQYGRYYRTRIPKPGRDFLYHPEHSELFFVGAMPEIHRLNLERGQFMKPLTTDGPEVNVCALNQFHRLFMCGTQEGKVEAWDPRDRRRAGIMDVALHSLTDEDAGTQLQSIPEVTALSFKDSLYYGVGLSDGKSLVFDLRADKPIVVKDQQNDLPIKKLLFHRGNQWSDLVMTADAKAVKLWRHDAGGKMVTSIEPEARINDLCVVDGNSGLLFIPSETTKVQVYYIPSLGLAPKWCHFLDNLTEELEENPNPEIYDNYKFVTQAELDSLGLSHLVGSPLLRAYMHGHFIDLRLYRKVKSMADPMAYDEYKKEKVKEKIKTITQSRVDLKQLPNVNRELAQRMAQIKDSNDDVGGDGEGGIVDKRKIAKERKKSAKVNKAAGFLADDRFQKMFENPDFQIDKESEEYKNIQPVLESLDKRVAEKKQKGKKKRLAAVETLGEEEDDSEESESEEEEDDDGGASSSSDEEEFAKKVRQKFQDRKSGRKNEKERLEQLDRDIQLVNGRSSGKNVSSNGLPRKRQIFDVEKKKAIKESSKSLAERAANAAQKSENDDDGKVKMTVGGMEATFVPKSLPPKGPRAPSSNAGGMGGVKKSFAARRKEEKEEEYHKRKKERRGAGGILPKPKLPPKFYMGKRVQ